MNNATKYLTRVTRWAQETATNEHGPYLTGRVVVESIAEIEHADRAELRRELDAHGVSPRDGRDDEQGVVRIGRWQLEWFPVATDEPATDEQAATDEAHELLSKIAIDGRPAAVTELLNRAELITDAERHLRLVRTAVELDARLRPAPAPAVDAGTQIMQIGAWLGRHGIAPIELTAERVIAARDADHDFALRVDRMNGLRAYRRSAAPELAPRDSYDDDMSQAELGACGHA